MTHEEVLDEINVIYERISRNEDFNDGNYLEALEVLIDYYEVGVVEELEKIKAVLYETAVKRSDGKFYYLRDEWIDEYLDKHINKLKERTNEKR